MCQIESCCHCLLFVAQRLTCSILWSKECTEHQIGFLGIQHLIKAQINEPWVWYYHVQLRAPMVLISQTNGHSSVCIQLLLQSCPFWIDIYIASVIRVPVLLCYFEAFLPLIPLT